MMPRGRFDNGNLAAKWELRDCQNNSMTDDTNNFAQQNPETYVIDDGVRRAKAAQLAGRVFVPVEIGSPPERSIEIHRLRSKKFNIALNTQDDRLRWEQIMKEYSPGGEPDLLPPIKARPGTEGIPIQDVTVGQ